MRLLADSCCSSRTVTSTDSGGTVEGEQRKLVRLYDEDIKFDHYKSCMV